MILAVGACIVSAAAGAVGGYFFAKRQLEKEYAEIARQEIEEARVFYKKDDDSTPEGALAKRRPGMHLDKTGLEDVHPEQIQGPPTDVLKKVLDGLKYGTPSEGGPKAPYVIAQDVFLNSEVGYPQVTLTYYADEVLADETDSPIEDIEMTVGIKNLTRFGQQSDDPRAVYIRNDRLQADYEVVLDDGTYAAVVGLDN